MIWRLFRAIYIYRDHNPDELKYIVMNLELYRVKLSNSGYLQYAIFCCIRFKTESNEFQNFTITQKVTLQFYIRLRKLKGLSWNHILTEEKVTKLNHQILKEKRLFTWYLYVLNESYVCLEMKVWLSKLLMDNGSLLVSVSKKCQFLGMMYRMMRFLWTVLWCKNDQLSCVTGSR